MITSLIEWKLIEESKRKKNMDLIIVDVQPAFSAFFTKKYVEELRKYCYKFDRVFQIWDNHKEENEDTIFQWPLTALNIEKSYGGKLEESEIDSYFVPDKADEIKKEWSTIKPGWMRQTKNGDFWLYIDGKHKWFYVSKEMAAFAYRLGKSDRSVTLCGGAGDASDDNIPALDHEGKKSECLADIAKVLRKFDVKFEIDYEFVYSAKGCLFTDPIKKEKVVKESLDKINNLIEEVKEFLIEDEKEMDNEYTWKDFIDNQKMGECQHIVSIISKLFKQFTPNFGHIQIDEEIYIPENDEFNDLFTHHWLELNGEIYDFSKGTLKNYIEWNDLYEVGDGSDDYKYNKIFKTKENKIFVDKPKEEKEPKKVKESIEHSDYLKWKRKNVTIRGIKNSPEEHNGVGSITLGDGFYTAALGNRDMANKYGKVYFVVNGKPKNPLIFDNTNKAEIWFQQNLYFKNYKNIRDFNKNTTIEKEIQKLGYDGVEIKGREMVNYKPENIKYFKTEEELKDYYNQISNIKEDYQQFEIPFNRKSKVPKLANKPDHVHFLNVVKEFARKTNFKEPFTSIGSYKEYLTDDLIIKQVDRLKGTGDYDSLEYLLGFFYDYKIEENPLYYNKKWFEDNGEEFNNDFNIINWENTHSEDILSELGYKEYNDFIHNKALVIINENGLLDALNNSDEEGIDIYRSIRIKSSGDTLASTSDVYQQLVNEYSGLGEYWSFDRNGAESHAGYGGSEYVFFGKVRLQDINWENTTYKNISNLRQEREIEVNSDAVIKLEKIYKTSEKTFLNLENPLYIQAV